MCRKIEIIYGKVVGKSNNYQTVPDGKGGKRIIKNDAIRQYERLFARQCKIYRDKNINVPFRFDVTVYFPSMRQDLDNALKTILDCLQYCHAITDDNLCREIQASKRIDKHHPRIEYSITPLEASEQNLFDYG